MLRWKLSSMSSFTGNLSFFKVARAGRRTRDLLVFFYFLNSKQRLRPLSYCSPLLGINLFNRLTGLLFIVFTESGDSCGVCAATWTPSYKWHFGVGYAGFCYAEILNKDFLVKNFGVAIFQHKFRQKSFIGSGPGKTYSELNFETCLIIKKAFIAFVSNFLLCSN